MLFVAGLWTATARPARAQDDSAPKKDETAAKTTDAADQVQSQNLFKHIVKSAGFFFGPLLLIISMILVTLILLLAMDLRMQIAIPPAFVDEFTDTVNKRRFREAFDLARNDNSYLGRVLTAGMGRLQYGIEDARDTAMNTVESLKANKEQLITYLATIGSLGPMIGLLGTVFGMILAFMELSSGSTPNAQKLADSISHALVITLLGIGLAVPAIFCHAFFRNRLIRIAMDTANVSDDLLTQMYHNSKKPAPTAAEARAAGTVTGATVKPAEG
jgi:biopolymer transport protein ExbB